MQAKGYEYIAGGATKSTRKTRGSRVAQKVAKAKAATECEGGSLIMNTEDFERLEQCMKNPRKPSKAMVEAAKLHRVLTSSR